MFGTKKRKVTFNHEASSVQESVIGIDLRDAREKMLVILDEMSEEKASKISLIMEKLINNFDKEEIAYLMVQLMVTKEKK